MTEPILVSVIIPCYNVAEYIEECLDSVYNQTYPYIEVIVVDNNSGDGTLELVKDYREINHTQLIIIHEKNQGLSFARNAGLKIAKGSWIQFLDADDLLLPEKIERQLRLINNGIDFICGATIERRVDKSEFVLKPISHDLTGLLIGYRSLGSSCSNLWRKSALIEVGGFNSDRRFGEEYELMFRLIKEGKERINDDEAMTIIRQRSQGQLTQSNPSEFNKEVLNISFEILKYYYIHLQNEINDWNRTYKTEVFRIMNYRLNLQSLRYLDLSHKQYHELLIPLFNNHIAYLPLKERVKHFLFGIYGFKTIRHILNKYRW